MGIGKYNIGEQVGEFKVIDYHEPSGGYVMSRPIQVRSVETIVKGSEFTILHGAMAAPICDLWLMVVIELQDLWDDAEGTRTEVNLLHLRDGYVEGWMSYEPGSEADRGHIGLAASQKMINQETRLRFLQKFDMHETDFNELNPPWRDLQADRG